MKTLFKWWSALEICKFLLIFISICTSQRTTSTIFMVILIGFLTTASFFKVVPFLKKLTNFILIEDDLKNRNDLIKARRLLGFLMLSDLIPMFPLIQAFLRWKYYKLDPKVDEIIIEISKKYSHIY